MRQIKLVNKKRKKRRKIFFSNFNFIAIPVNNRITTTGPTTMDNSWSHFQNIQEWTSDDVIEWLNREKLEM